MRANGVIVLGRWSVWLGSIVLLLMAFTARQASGLSVLAVCSVALGIGLLLLYLPSDVGDASPTVSSEREEEHAG